MAENSDSTDEKLFIKADCKMRINKWRLREGFPVNNSQIVLIYEEQDTENGSSKIEKLKSTQFGVVKKRFFKDGDIVEAGQNLLELSECTHMTVVKDMCAVCGNDLRQNVKGKKIEASVPMIHSMPDLKVTQKLAQKLGQDDTRRLLQDRKLVLLVDLDQTVIHTTNDNVPNNIKGIYHFQLYGPNSPWYHTRLRPGTSKFLESISEFYELHICTFGARNYAHMIAHLLDPQGKYFSHRILSRDECFNATSKTDNLKALFPNGDSMVCIIDDREDVWNMASNLIQVKPYHFFQHTGDINAPPGLSKHELDGEGVDFKVLKILATDKDNKEGIETESKSKGSDSEASEFSTEKSQKTEVSILDRKDDSEPDTTINETNESKAKNVEAEPATTSVTVADAQEIPSSSQADDNSHVSNSEDKPIVTSTTEENDKVNSAKSPKEIEKENGNEQVQVKDDDENDDVDVTRLSPKIKLPTDANNQIEIEDPDDYLLHLEVILRNIHTRFYSIFDETNEIPDLKIIVPKIRSEVLRGQNLIFSGLVPTNMRLEQSRAYFIAKSLGANVSQNMGPEITHLVAVTAGTFKVNAARKNPQIKVVNANWLWSCAERWEHVDERLFPLDRKTKSKQRQPPAHCHSPEHVVNYSDKSEISSSSSAQCIASSEPTKFYNTINPLLLFSNDDLDAMNKEFHQFFESDSSSEDEPINIENPPVDKNLRKRKREERDAERTHKFFTQSTDVNFTNDNNFDANKSSNEEEDDEDEDEDESPSDKFRRGLQLPSDLEMGSDSNDDSNDDPDEEDDGDWNMMGAALEREFLGLED